MPPLMKISGSGRSVSRRSRYRPPSLFRSIVLLLTVLFTLGLGAPAFGEPTEKRLMLAGYEGVPLDTILNTPDAALGARGPYPAILLISPWSVPTDVYRALARELASHGYVVLSVMPRGMGRSGGAVDLAGFKDQEDVRRLLDWLCAYPPVDCTRIGTAGISYGGALGLNMAAQDERIHAVVAMSSWIDLGGSFLRQGTSPAAWMGILRFFLNNFGRSDAAFDSLIRNFYAYRVTTRDLSLWSTPRSPLSYSAELRRLKPAILIEHELEDSLFWLSDILSFYERLAGPKELHVNDGDHSLTAYGGVLTPGSEIILHIRAWFDRHLKGEQTAITASDETMRFPLLNSDDTIRVHQLSEISTRAKRLFLERPAHRGPGTLREAPPGDAGAVPFTLVSGREQNVGPVMPVIGPDLRAGFHNKTWVKPLAEMDPAKVATFVLAPVAEDTFLFGTPSLKVWITPHMRQVQLIAYLYQWDGGPHAKPVVYGALTLQDVTPHRPMQVTLNLRTASLCLPKGQALLLALGTYDESSLALPAPFSLDILLDTRHAAEFHLPYLMNAEDVLKTQNAGQELRCRP